METEKARNAIRTKSDREKSKTNKLEVSNGRLKSEIADTTKAPTAEVPNIRLAPEQIEEIHTDEYSLTLFYATRIAPMSAADIKRDFPEPEPKKAQSVMDRFVKVGLVHITADGKYYSNYPENYINYSHYRYDNDLEARKDAKVFRLMKEFTGNKEYWKDKTYFSMDAFYSEEQSAELLEMFKQIKLKAKQYANDNAKKKTTKGMKFRRMKFYDINFALLVAFVISCLGMMGGTPAHAGGNDPTMRAAFASYGQQRTLDFLSLARLSGGGNDPTMMVASLPDSAAISGDQPEADGGGGHDPSKSGPDKTNNNGGHDPDPSGNDPIACGGGGHDPENCVSCVLEIEGTKIPVQSPRVCRLKKLIDFSVQCGQSQHPACVEVDRQIDDLLKLIEREEGRLD